MQLREMKPGTKGRILKIQDGEVSYRKKLIALGLLPGTEFLVSRIAPLGDPIEIIVRGFALILRKKEATILAVEGIKS